jgi:hypothetical protein
MLVAHACNPSYLGGRDQENCGLKPAPGKLVQETVSQKNPTQNRPSRVAQVVELLPSKCEALSSNSSTGKKLNC